MAFLILSMEKASLLPSRLMMKMFALIIGFFDKLNLNSREFGGNEKGI